MTEYMFEHNQEDRELARLRMIEAALDGSTIGRLQRTGIQRGWRCLELGAGAGSIMRWMSDVVGTTGDVVGVDKSVSYLQDLSAPPFQIVEGDFLETTLEKKFDLIHCRYVLIHNHNSDQMLAKLCKLLKPGGYLVIEEPDFMSAKLLNRNGDQSQQRVNNAICRMFEEMGLDPDYGLRLPEKVSHEGIQTVDVDSRVHLCRGGDAIARMMAESTTALSDRYIATGEVTEEDIQQYVENAEDDQFWSVYYSTVAVIAKK